MALAEAFQSLYQMIRKLLKNKKIRMLREQQKK